MKVEVFLTDGRSITLDNVKASRHSGSEMTFYSKENCEDDHVIAVFNFSYLLGWAAHIQPDTD